MRQKSGWPGKTSSSPGTRASDALDRRSEGKFHARRVALGSKDRFCCVARVWNWHKLDPLLGGTFRGRQPRQFGTFLTRSSHRCIAANYPSFNQFEGPWFPHAPPRISRGFRKARNRPNNQTRLAALAWARCWTALTPVRESASEVSWSELSHTTADGMGATILLLPKTGSKRGERSKPKHMIACFHCR
jgi:hypothetical protein